MDTTEKARLLIRAARHSPSDAPALLSWADDLLSTGQNGTGRVRHAERIERTEVDFPLAVMLRTRKREATGLFYADGRLECEGVMYKSPSAAAVAVLGYSANGWRLWWYQDSDGKWKQIDNLRKK